MMLPVKCLQRFYTRREMTSNQTINHGVGVICGNLAKTTYNLLLLRTLVVDIILSCHFLEFSQMAIYIAYYMDNITTLEKAIKTNVLFRRFQKQKYTETILDYYLTRNTVYSKVLQMIIIITVISNTVLYDVIKSRLICVTKAM